MRAKVEPQSDAGGAMSARPQAFGKGETAAHLTPAVVRDVVLAASDITLHIDENAVILSVMLNSRSDGFGNLDHWAGRPVTDFLTEESIAKFEEAHATFLAGGDLRKQFEMNHHDNASWEFPVRYAFVRLGDSDDALLIGRDLRPVAEAQQQLVHAQIALEKGYEARREFDARYRVLLNSVREAVVFVSVRDGRVKDLNDPAAAILGMGREQLSGAPFVNAFKDRSSGELIESLLNASIADGDQGLTVPSM